MKRSIDNELAINGGRPVRVDPFPPWPAYSERQVDRATEVLRSGAVNYWTGSEGREFEKEFAAMCGARYAIAVANGTVSLELGLEALGIGLGDEVIVTPRTFLASASSIVRRGAVPVFADVDRDSQNLTADSIQSVLTPKTKGIMPVHLAGWPCNMEAICALAKDNELGIIEDCAQAVGARHKGQHVGTFGEIGSFSFCQDKSMTTGGEGGMLVTNDEQLWSRLWSLKDHGKDFATVYPSKPPTSRHQFPWLHHSFGTNGRMTEMQSAIGREQLMLLPSWTDIRRRHADRLAACFNQIDALRTPLPDSDTLHSYYKCYTFVRPEKLEINWDRDAILSAINAEGIPCFSGSCSEVYLEKAFAGTEMPPPQRLPVARELGETSLMFLVHPTITNADIEDTCAAVDKVFAAAQRR